MIDADTQLLPDQLTQPLLWLGLLLNLAGVFASLADAVIGAAAGYLLLASTGSSSWCAARRAWATATSS